MLLRYCHPLPALAFSWTPSGGPQSRALSASGSPSILVKAHNSPEPHSRFFSLDPLGPSSADLAWPAPIAGPRHAAPRRCQAGRRTPSRSIHPTSAVVRAALHRRLLLGEHLFSPSRIPIRNSRSVVPPPRRAPSTRSRHSTTSHRHALTRASTSIRSCHRPSSLFATSHRHQHLRHPLYHRRRSQWSLIPEARSCRSHCQPPTLPGNPAQPHGSHQPCLSTLELSVSSWLFICNHFLLAVHRKQPDSLVPSCLSFHIHRSDVGTQTDAEGLSAQQPRRICRCSSASHHHQIPVRSPGRQDDAVGLQRDHRCTCLLQRCRARSQEAQTLSEGLHPLPRSEAQVRRRLPLRALPQTQARLQGALRNQRRHPSSNRVNSDDRDAKAHTASYTSSIAAHPHSHANSQLTPSGIPSHGPALPPYASSRPDGVTSDRSRFLSHSHLGPQHREAMSHHPSDRFGYSLPDAVRRIDLLERTVSRLVERVEGHPAPLDRSNHYNSGRPTSSRSAASPHKPERKRARADSPKIPMLKSTSCRMVPQRRACLFSLCRTISDAPVVRSSMARLSTPHRLDPLTEWRLLSRLPRHPSSTIPPGQTAMALDTHPSAIPSTPVSSRSSWDKCSSNSSSPTATSLHPSSSWTTKSASPVLRLQSPFCFRFFSLSGHCTTTRMVKKAHRTLRDPHRARIVCALTDGLASLQLRSHNRFRSGDPSHCVLASGFSGCPDENRYRATLPTCYRASLDAPRSAQSTANGHHPAIHIASRRSGRAPELSRRLQQLTPAKEWT